MIRLKSRLTALVCTVAMVAMVVAPTAAIAGDSPGAAFDPRTTKVLRSLAADRVGTAELPDVGNTPATAVALPASPAQGTLDLSTDAVDVYSVALADGDRIGVTLTGDATLNADVMLYAPGTSNIVTTPALAATAGDGYPKTFTFRVTTAGTYYVAVAAASGAGTYYLGWYAAPWDSDNDSEIPGAVPGPTVSDTIDVINDPDDVWAITVGDGKRLRAELSTWDSSLTPELYLYGPDATSILTALPVAASVSGPDRQLYYDVPAGSGSDGTYYLDVRAAAGDGAYELEWSVSDLGTDVWMNIGDAIALPASPASADLDASKAANIIYRVDIAAGERLDLRLVSPVDADFDVYLYPPGTANIYATAPVAWADGFDTEDSVTFDAVTTGTYYIEVRSFEGSGVFNLYWAKSATPVLGTTERIWGSDRYQTAIEISRKTFAADSCKTVVLATGADYPDALAASGLAGVYDSPVLLTPQAAVPTGLITEIKRLGATQVVIVGGTVAVSANVEAQLKAGGLTTSRAAGPDRYATAADVARKIFAIVGPRAESPAFVVRGDAFPDALAAAPIAYANAFPVLLTSVNSLPPVTAAAITQTGIDEIVIAGGPVAVSTGVETMLANLAGVRTVHREAGADRYETAAKVAEYGVRMWWAENTYIGIATGVVFADALGGGAAAGANGGVVLLTRPETLSAPAGAYLKAAKADVLTPKLYGGTAAISDVVKAAIDAALQ